MHLMILRGMQFKNLIAKYSDMQIRFSARTYCKFILVTN